MILLNFSHPLTREQLDRIVELAGQPIEQLLNLPVHFDNEQEFEPQLETLLSRLPLSAEELQTGSILVNPPSLNYITAILLAKLHGLLGYFPAVVRLRPQANSLPTRYEVAEILNLQRIRDQARKKRYA